MLRDRRALVDRILLAAADLADRLAVSATAPSLALAASGSGGSLDFTFVSNAPSSVTGDGMPAGREVPRSGGSARVFSWGGSAHVGAYAPADSALCVSVTSEFPAAGLMASETRTGVAGAIGGSSNKTCSGNAVHSGPSGLAIVGEFPGPGGGGVAHAKNGNCMGPSVGGNRHYVIRGRKWKGVSLCDTT